MALYGNDRAFYWSAAQCLEKYLKAILLYRGVAIKDLSHNIEKLFEKVKIEVKEFADFQFDIDLSNSVDEHIVDVMELYNIKDFISLITLLGSPHQRYNQSGYNFNSSLVFHLDSLVYFTRSLLTEWPIEGSLLNLYNQTCSMCFTYRMIFLSAIRVALSSHIWLASFATFQI